MPAASFRFILTASRSMATINYRCLIDDCRVDRGVLNMRWIVEILIHRKIGDEFVKLWAEQN